MFEVLDCNSDKIGNEGIIEYGNDFRQNRICRKILKNNQN